MRGFLFPVLFVITGLMMVIVLSSLRPDESKKNKVTPYEQARKWAVSMDVPYQNIICFQRQAGFTTRCSIRTNYPFQPVLINIECTTLGVYLNPGCQLSKE